MATKRSAKGTKAPVRKRKPAPKAPRRTIIADTMTPQPETRESVMDMGPITIQGRFDDGELIASRRFLWWDVAREHGAPIAILSPWWERALYAVARIWS